MADRCHWPKLWLLFVLFSLVIPVGCRGKKPWTGMWTPGDTVDNIGYHPDQPIPQFSHKLHAGDKNIPCQYCHSSARRSMVAGIPSTNTCMGCHRFVKTDSPAIKKVTEYYNKHQPIPWTKVNDIPDFVRFTHKRHIAAGVDCSVCHGDVKNMTTVEQAAPLQMGWCIDCHIQKGAPTDCVHCHY